MKFSCWTLVALGAKVESGTVVDSIPGLSWHQLHCRVNSFVHAGIFLFFSLKLLLIICQSDPIFVKVIRSFSVDVQDLGL